MPRSPASLPGSTDLRFHLDGQVEHHVLCSVTTIPWTCPSCSPWGGQNLLYFLFCYFCLFCVPWNLRSFDHGQRPCPCLPEGLLEELQTEGTCTMTRFHYSGFGLLSDRAMSLTGPNVKIKFLSTAILQPCIVDVSISRRTMVCALTVMRLGSTSGWSNTWLQGEPGQWETSVWRMKLQQEQIHTARWSDSSTPG